VPGTTVAGAPQKRRRLSAAVICMTTPQQLMANGMPAEAQQPGAD
jgi:hypothetical protein